MNFNILISLYYYYLTHILIYTNFNSCKSTSEINPYKDIQKILTEDFNPHVPEAETTVLPWKMNYSYKENKILEFKDKSDFPLQEICKCSLEEVNEMESNIVFGTGAL